MKTLPAEYINRSLSHATMKAEDLIPDFMGFLESVSESCDIISEVSAITELVDTLVIKEVTGYGENYTEERQEAASYILNEDIWNLLNEIAPAGSFGFGAHPGNGSDYGFWAVEPENISGFIWLHDTSGKNVDIYCEITNGIPESAIFPDLFRGQLYVKLKNVSGTYIQKLGPSMEYQMTYSDIFSAMYGTIVEYPL